MTTTAPATNPSRRRRRIAIVLGALILGLAPGFALADATSPLNPASSGAGGIASLFWLLLILAGIIFVGVEGALLYAIFHFRERTGRAAATFHGNTRLEIIWTALPILLLGTIYVLTLRTMTAATTAGGSDPVDVNVIGHQWWWEFDYPGEKVVTAGELHVPVGETIILHVRSADVIHSFWMPQLAGKMDANPGFANTITFTPAKVGVYDAICSELCGVEHALMRARVIVESPADYAAWVRQQQASLPVPSGLAQQGEQIYQTESCASCHQPSAAAGPDLSHVALRGILAGGAIPNTPDNLARWLADPQAIKPGTKMPNYHLTPDQIKALTAYLESRR